LSLTEISSESEKQEGERREKSWEKGGVWKRDKEKSKESHEKVNRIVTNAENNRIGNRMCCEKMIRKRRTRQK
jgi:hypothetical protein